jgi:predicted dehydrogenase
MDMRDNKIIKISRRKFVGTSLFGMGGFAILPGLSAMQVAPSDTINLGFIGLGQQAMNLLNGFINIQGVRVIAGCDVYGVKNQRFEQMVIGHYSGTAKKKVKVNIYHRYQDLLAQKDIDAVIIATPDHWHALQAIDACKAGKDVYLEKPLTFTIKEGQELVKCVRQNNRILGVGSQQRSGIDFIKAVKMVRDGSIGKLERINAYVGAPPRAYNLPEEPVPVDLDWDLWLGPSPFVHYNKELNPPIYLNPPQKEQFWGGWRWYKELGGGFTTDWGAHMFDIVQWAMGMDNSGPSRIIPAGYQDYDYLTFEYSNGIIMSERPWDENKTKGVKFWGSNGWLEISRNNLNVSDESLKLKENLGDKVSHRANYLNAIVSHHADFINAVRNKKDPVTPVEVGHRTCTACTLGNIAHELGRPVVWNPVEERFVNDAEAAKFLHREYREGYVLG